MNVPAASTWLSCSARLIRGATARWVIPAAAALARDGPAGSQESAQAAATDDTGDDTADCHDTGAGLPCGPDEVWIEPAPWCRRLTFGSLRAPFPFLFRSCEVKAGNGWSRVFARRSAARRWVADYCAWRQAR
jgi:hypothetical protein